MLHFTENVTVVAVVVIVVLYVVRNDKAPSDFFRLLCLCFTYL